VLEVGTLGDRRRQRRGSGVGLKAQPFVSVFSRILTTTLPMAPRALVWRVAKRYVAGPKLEDAIATVQRLNGEGAMATVDVLGEAVEDKAAALQSVEKYLEVLDAIRDLGLDANISVKPTMFGLSQDEAFAGDNIERLAVAAKERNTFVRIDMEDRTTTTATLALAHRLFATYGNVGTVLQAYMRRTLDDIEALPTGCSVRLCKGIYIEPREAAWKGYDTVRAAFVAALELLIQRDIYVGIATHDEYLVMRSIDMLRRRRVPRDRYEFQMLLGVDDQLRKILLGEGHRLRVYVPFGPDWYLYSMRRLRENPEIAMHVTRAFLGGR
jgi:proline dehydrogenase